MVENFVQKTPFIRIVIPFMAGIVAAGWFSVIPVKWALGITGISLIVTISVAVRGGFLRNLIAGALFSLVFFLSGFTLFLHYDRIPALPDACCYVVTLAESPDEREKSFRAEALVSLAGDQDSLTRHEERLLLYFEKSPEVAGLRAGDQVVFTAEVRYLANDLNPYAFDFKGYMHRRGIYRQVYLRAGDWKPAGRSEQFNLRISSESVREQLTGIYRRYNLQGDTLAILSALTLGDKKAIDPEVRQVFSNSGAMHVLAVSGLHVGIIFLAFNLVFSFLKRIPRGNYLLIGLGIMVLWTYALLTGLSPSVQRAALMFSMVQVAGGLRRPANIYNTLAASCFVLLAVNPNLLFEVGFQLSYSAVFSIVYFQPGLSALVPLRNKLARYFTGLLSVSLAAQIGTFALSCFYFRQLPVWFWITNLVVIPAAFVFIVLAIFIILADPLPMVAKLIAGFTGKLVGLMYDFLELVESLPFSVLAVRGFGLLSLAVSVLGIFVLVLFIESRRRVFLFSFLTLWSLFFISSGIRKLQAGRHCEIIVYSADAPVIHCISGRNNYVVALSDHPTQVRHQMMVRNVVDALGLTRPVSIGLDSDFESRDVFKKGNLLFCKGKTIALPGYAGTNDGALTPDVYLDFHGLPRLVTPVAGGVVVSSRYPSVEDQSGAVRHYLRQQGAFRIKL